MGSGARFGSVLLSDMRKSEGSWRGDAAGVWISGRRVIHPISSREYATPRSRQRLLFQVRTRAKYTRFTRFCTVGTRSLDASLSSSKRLPLGQHFDVVHTVLDNACAARLTRACSGVGVAALGVTCHAKVAAPAAHSGQRH